MSGSISVMSADDVLGEELSFVFPKEYERAQPADDRHRAILAEASKVSRAVDRTVEQLRDLESRMHAEDFQFGESAFTQLQEVQSSLQILEEFCRRQRDALEAENITWSGLFHTRNDMPRRLGLEIHELMTTLVRENKKSESHLNDIIQARDIRILDKRKRLESVVEEIRKLRVQVKEAQSRHEHDVIELNDVMSEKARWRIKLNERNAEDAVLVDLIAELEGKIKRLNDELDSERKDIESQMDELAEKVAQRKDYVQRKEDESFAIRRELATVEITANSSTEEVKLLQRELDSLTEACMGLRHKRTAIKQELDSTCRQVLKKQAEGRATVAAQVAATEAHQNRLKDMDNKKKEAIETIRYAESEMENLQPRFKDVRKGHSRSKNRAEAEGGRLASIQETVDSARTTLAEETQSCSQATIDFEQLTIKEKQLHQGLKAHKTMAMEAKVEAENRLQQKKERRMQLQLQRDEVLEKKIQKETELQQSNLETTTKFETTKQKCEELQSQATTHKERLRSGTAEISTLRENFTELKTRYKDTKASLERKRDGLEEDVQSLKRQLAVNTAAIEKLEPVVVDLRSQHGGLASRSEEDRKRAIELKNKRASLSDQTARTDRDMERLPAPQERLLEEIRKERSAGTRQLQDQSVETKDIDGRLFRAKCRVETLDVENQRFVQAIKTMDDECARTGRKREESRSVKKSLEGELASLQAQLAKGWANTSDMEQEYSRSDREVIDHLDELLRKLSKRQLSVKEIEGQLQAELTHLEQVKESVTL